MYHYLKWATLGLFFRRNARYLLLIAIGVVGIYVADAVYQDMAQYAAAAGHPEKIGFYLLAKWIVVALLAGLVLFSIFRLGFSRSDGKKVKRAKEKKRAEKEAKKERIAKEEEAIMRRLEKFKEPRKLRRRADLVLEKKRPFWRKKG